MAFGACETLIHFVLLLFMTRIHSCHYVHIIKFKEISNSDEN